MLLIYIAVFSNMVCNVVLIIPMALSFAGFTFNEIKMNGVKSVISKSFIKRNMYCLYTFCLEVVCLVFEYNGGRAQSFDVDMMTELSNMRTDIAYILRHINRPVFIGMVIVFLLAGGICIKSGDKMLLRIMGLCTSALILTVLYMFLLYLRIGDHKIQRCENIFVMGVLGMLLFALSLGYLLDRYQKAVVVMPVAIYILCSLTLSREYKQSISYYGGNTQLCYLVDTNIVNQYIEAEQEGKEEFELHVPRDGLGSYSFSAERISSTLYNHGITAHRLKANMVLEDDAYFIE